MWGGGGGVLENCVNKGLQSNLQASGTSTKFFSQTMQESLCYFIKETTGTKD
jgi:hypothetical protein